MIPSEVRSEGTSWLLCVSILAREPPNWGGSATGRSQDTRQETGKGLTPPWALCRVLDTSWLVHYINIPTNTPNSEGTGGRHYPPRLSACSGQARFLALNYGLTLPASLGIRLCCYLLLQPRKLRHKTVQSVARGHAVCVENRSLDRVSRPRLTARSDHLHGEQRGSPGCAHS